MSKARGTVLPVTPGRRLIAEWMHHAKKVPSLPLSRTCHIPQLVAARKNSRPAVSWMAIFLRAYGLAGKEFPELRRAWIPFPWAHIYEHPTSEPAILIERDHDGDPIVLAAKIRSPEDGTVLGIDEHLQRFRDTPVTEIAAFRQLMRLARLPWPLRRFFMWKALNVSGYRRACRCGTFVISSLGNFGVEQMHPLTALTTYFTYGPIGSDGSVTLKVIYDHRVMDGRCVARVLVRVEELLNSVILEEVRRLGYYTSSAADTLHVQASHP